jgi:hypothetical protein
MKWRDVGVAGWAPWLVAATVLLAGCSAGPAHTQVRPVSVTASGTSVSPAAQASPPAVGGLPAPPGLKPPPPTAPPPPIALPVAPGAGRLRQTQAFPSTKSVAFHDAMYDLWLSVTTGKARFGLPAFFPEAAYEQLKAIAYPESDWQYRLWYDFTLDVTAAHDLLGHGARLVTVIVSNQYAAWVPPGYCYNSIGYWHMPGARVVYREDGQLRSFGIASLISWRGVWYVVHFGAVLRSGGGEVDDPTTGEGYTGPPGGC